MEIRMRPAETVIITGSRRLIGSALVNKLSARFCLVGFDKIAHRTPPPTAEYVCIDLTDEHAVKAAFERVRIAYGDRIASVIHLATYYDLSGTPFGPAVTWPWREPKVTSRRASVTGALSWS